MPARAKAAVPRDAVAAGGQTVRVGEGRVGAAAGGAVVGVVVVGVWAAAYAVAGVLVPAGFEGEHLERSLAAWMLLAVAGSLVAAALLARGLRLRHPWPFAAWGLVLAVIVAFCGFVIARGMPDTVGGVVLVACIAGVYAGLAASVSGTAYQD
jgi:hypothetical protein